jgi:hypothetical protein
MAGTVLFRLSFCQILKGFGSARTAPTGRALRFPPLGSGATKPVKSAPRSTAPWATQFHPQKVHWTFCRASGTNWIEHLDPNQSHTPLIMQNSLAAALRRRPCPERNLQCFALLPSSIPSSLPPCRAASSLRRWSRGTIR